MIAWDLIIWTALAKAIDLLLRWQIENAVYLKPGVYPNII
jgi:hypothetical protein